MGRQFMEGCVCVCVYCREEALPFKVVFIWPIFIFNGHFINARSRDPSSKRSKHQAHKIHLLSGVSMCVC